MGQSRMPHSDEPQPDENIPLNVPTLLRRATDAYEEKVLPMFEGYMLSLKGHFHTEVGTLRTDLQAIKTSVHDLETKVGVEIEKMMTLTKGGGFFDDELPRGGGSPYDMSLHTKVVRMNFPQHSFPHHTLRLVFKFTFTASNLVTAI